MFSFYQLLFREDYTKLYEFLTSTGAELICIVITADGSNVEILCSCKDTKAGIIISDNSGKVTFVSPTWKDFYFYCTRHKIKFLSNEKNIS